MHKLKFIIVLLATISLTYLLNNPIPLASNPAPPCDSNDVDSSSAGCPSCIQLADMYAHSKHPLTESGAHSMTIK